jgi:hypothetical protein
MPITNNIPTDKASTLPRPQGRRDEIFLWRRSSGGRLSQQAAGYRFVDPVAMHELLHDRLGEELIESRLV